jgi:hypothetical protein
MTAGLRAPFRPTCLAELTRMAAHWRGGPVGRCQGDFAVSVQRIVSAGPIVTVLAQTALAHARSRCAHGGDPPGPGPGPQPR